MLTPQRLRSTSVAARCRLEGGASMTEMLEHMSATWHDRVWQGRYFRAFVCRLRLCRGAVSFDSG